MISIIKGVLCLISLPFHYHFIFISLPFSAYIFYNYELIISGCLVLLYSISGKYILHNIDNYIKQKKEKNRMKIIKFINDNIDKIDIIENDEIISIKLKELKKYYYGSNDDIKNDLCDNYSTRENNKMLNNIKQNYKISNIFIKNELNKYDEMLINYKNYINKLLKTID